MKGEGTIEKAAQMSSYLLLPLLLDILFRNGHVIQTCGK
jgi:hypothetical protein